MRLAEVGGAISFFIFLYMSLLQSSSIMQAGQKLISFSMFSFIMTAGFPFIFALSVLSVRTLGKALVSCCLALTWFSKAEFDLNGQIVIEQVSLLYLLKSVSIGVVVIFLNGKPSFLKIEATWNAWSHWIQSQSFPLCRVVHSLNFCQCYEQEPNTLLLLFPDFSEKSIHTTFAILAATFGVKFYYCFITLRRVIRLVLHERFH